MIEVKNLQKAFGGNMVLKGVTETIEKGEKIAIIGPSGSGKSTFLRCLNRLEEPTGGEIWFEGKDITAKDCDINRIRRKMGIPAFQPVPASDGETEYHAGARQPEAADTGRGG